VSSSGLAATRRQIVPRSAAPTIIIAGLALLTAACQAGANAPRSTVTASPTSALTTEPTPTQLPSAIPRPTDITKDGTCEQRASCLGLLEPGKSYRTSAFTPQITFTITEAGWENLSDEGGVFQLLPIAYPGDALLFFRDPTATDARGQEPREVGTTVGDLAAWLAKNPLLAVTPPKPVTVGGLKGVTMDIKIAAGAQNHPADCPVRVCVPFFAGTDPAKYKTWQWDWGSGSDLRNAVNDAMLPAMAAHEFGSLQAMPCAVDLLCRLEGEPSRCTRRGAITSR